MKIIILLLLTIFSFNIEAKNYNYEELKKQINYLKTKLPQNIDKNTVLYEINLKDNNLELKYKLINWTKKEVKDSNQDLNNIQKALSFVIIPSFCDVEFYKKLINSEININPMYFTSDEFFLFDYDITKKSCK